MGSEVSIVVPTYREADNLPELVSRIASTTNAHRIDYEIIIVDDDSNDGTVAVCDALRDSANVRLVVRKQDRGLSSAVLHGINLATGEVVVVMDADLSHPPEVLPQLIDSIQQGAEMVIGSRYVHGGETEETWGFIRWLNSKIATLLARPLTSVKDPMAGFFALRRDVYGRARELNPIGYKIGLELLVKTDCRRVEEVPIRFADRKRGSSKLCLREQLNYLKHLKRLYDHKFGAASRLVQFLAIGASGMAVDLSAFVLLVYVVPFGVARGLAIWVAMTWNWYLNRCVTFDDRRGQPKLVEYLLFCGSCALGGIANWVTTVQLHQTFAVFHRFPVLAAVVGIAAGTLFNAICCFQFVFQSKPADGSPTDQALSKRRRLATGIERSVPNVEALSPAQISGPTKE